jgi:hypothetical protein
VKRLDGVPTKASVPAIVHAADNHTNLTGKRSVQFRPKAPSVHRSSTRRKLKLIPFSSYDKHRISTGGLADNQS